MADTPAASGERLLVLDTASLYFRAFFGVPDRFSAPDGTPVNALRGMTDFVSRLLEEYQPSHLVCAWDDNWRPQWRIDLVPTYKEHRVVEVTGPGVPDVEEVPERLTVQIGLIRGMLEAFGIAVIGHPDMEADDVIGTLAATSTMPVDIVTGDRDLFQLVDDARGIRVLYTARGVSKHERVDEAWVQQKYGVTASQYVDFATMRGDASDGLPGVPGVGEKTAAGLLGEFASLEAIIAAAHDETTSLKKGPRAKLIAAEEYIRDAVVAVRVRPDLELGPHAATEAIRVPRPVRDLEAVRALGERWGVASSVERLVATLGHDAG